MLDSFNAVANENKFYPYEFLSELCKGTKVDLNSYSEYRFKEGWKLIIEEFIHSIKNQSINLIKLEEQFGQVEIEFTVREKAMEVRVWRHIHNLRNTSKHTCTKCGEQGRRQWYGEKITVLCRACKANAEENGETGTWLDKY